MYKLIDKGAIPAFRIGRLFRIRRSEVDDFLERSRVRPDLAHLYPPDHEERDEE